VRLALRGLRQWGLAAALVVVCCALFAQVAVPPLTARVTDLTGTLTAQQRTALEERLAAFEKRKGSQLAVLIVPTTQPDAIEQFGIRVAEQWKVGRKGVDDGAILVIALKDRALRIEVGYGLEGVLSDITAKRIVEDYIVPRFKAGDFYGGIDAGVTRMMAVIDGEPLPPPQRTGASKGGPQGFQELLIIGFMLIFVVGGIVRALFGRFLGSGVIGAIGGAAAWLILGSIAAAVVVAIIAAVLSLMGGMAGAGRGRGGWYSGLPGGGWGGSGGWSGGGGGSWGGGGGGFGGGGASGRW
jgi:uncharacterized protein